MDPLTDFLDGRTLRPVVTTAALAAPWEVVVGPSPALVLVAAVAGQAALWHDDQAPTRLTQGDILLLRCPTRVTVRHASGPATLGEPPAFVTPRRPSVSGSDIRVTGADADGPDVLLVAAYPGSAEGASSVTSALPEVITVESGLPDGAVLAGIEAEAREPRIGGEAVCSRLADLAVVTAMRTWFAGLDDAEHSWLRASWDPVVGAALRLIHDESSREWSLATLADAVGCPRSVLTRRFQALVGEPPMTYLTQWRLTLAGDLLSRPGATVAGVARSVGYDDPFAFSAAFSRRYDLSPQRYRRERSGASAHSG